MIFYSLHWLCSLCVLAIAATLKRRIDFYLVSATTCWWKSIGMCRFVVAWGVFGWLVTSGLIALYVIGALGIWAFPLLAEMGIWIGGAVYWSVAAIASVAVERTLGDDRTTGYVVILLLWLLIPLSITSSILCCSARCCGRRGKKTGNGEEDTEAGHAAAVDTRSTVADEVPDQAASVPAPVTSTPAAS